MSAANTPRTVRVAMSGAMLSVEDMIVNVRKATWSRVGFAVVMAALSLLAAHPLVSLAWLASVVAWELAFRGALEAALAMPAARRSRQQGLYWLAAIHFVGAIIHGAYALITWSSGHPVGMVLATAWICASANHLFVYFTPNRLLVVACLAPLVAYALVAPFTTEGVTIPALIALATLAVMIIAAGLFGFDRRVLLGNLAEQASARAAAEEANAAKSRFLATLSHELRTPLNAVIGYAELIEEEASDHIAKDATRIRNAARQLLSVIDVILDLSKLDSGTIELDRERVAASAVLEQLRETAPALAAVNGNTITIVEASPLGNAEIDHRRLYQCLMQLVSNAAKFTNRGDIRVTAVRREESGRIVLEFNVADTGVGVLSQHQAQIFDAFVQIDKDDDRRYEGAGLGLTLVRRLARLMGGDVRLVSSVPGQGAVFSLWVDGGPA